MTDDKICCRCLHWKRRDDRFGQCYHPTKDPIPVRVHQAFTCSYWTAKTEKATADQMGDRS